MKLDERKSFDILSSLRVMGDPEYGGTGSISENILVGYLYGILSEKSSAVIRVDREDMKVIKYGAYSYIIWFDDIIDDLEEEVAQEETSEDTEPGDIMLLPVAIEGPFNDREIMELIHEGAI
ncbi:MAG: hypothetical protein AMDU2_EPLC00006G0362 [Thermoplasmatales archaeon E-plasma]|jgi:hypothetical protein|nr:MAG: hypothetical protein AMDU2_EPLC00006G0362 [Thermoplasmatales archaeon E-plasma]